MGFAQLAINLQQWHRPSSKTETEHRAQAAERPGGCSVISFINLAVWPGGSTMISLLRQGASALSGAPCAVAKAIADEDDHLEVAGRFWCHQAGRATARTGGIFLLAVQVRKDRRYDLRWFHADLKSA